MTNSFDWNQYKSIKEESITPKEPSFDWEQYQAVPTSPTPTQAQEPIFPKSEEEISPKSEKIAKSFEFFGKRPFTPEQIEEARQKVGVGLKRFAGGLLGTPGDITQLIKGAVGYGAEKIIGKEAAEKVGKPISKVLGVIPTSEQVENFYEKMSGEKFPAESFADKLIGNTTGFLGSILSLGGPLKATAKVSGPVRTALSAFVPAAAVTGTEEAGLPPWAQASAAIGSSLILHRMTGKSLKQIEKGWYKNAEELAKGKFVNSVPLERNLNLLESAIEKGGKTSSKTAVSGLISDIKSKMKYGRIDVDELIEFKRNINERMGEFEKLKGSKNLFKAVARTVDHGIQQYERTDPAFKEAYRSANSLHKGLNEARYIERFMRKHPIIGAELGIFSHLLPLPLPVKLGALKSGEVIAALVRNKGLRKAYMDVLKNASKNEVKGTVNSLRNFNKKAKEENLEE